MKKIFPQVLLSLILMFFFYNSIAQTDNATIPTAEDKSRSLPFFFDWAKNKGIELPSPFGITGFYTFMNRDIQITDVKVEFGGNEPQSISDIASFAVANRTTLAAAKFDVWILPVVNIYLLAGYAYTSSNLDATLTVDRPLLPPTDIQVQTTTPVKGPYAGIGSTLVAGYRNWFILGDFNYGKTLPDKLNSSISFSMYSVRSGLSGKLGGKNSIKAWIGTIYMDSKSTLEIKAPSAVLGDVLVRIDQNPVNPWTFQTGFMIGISDKLEIMTELGSNFDDASISVVTIAYRF